MSESSEKSNPRWYCLRTQIKREHIAVSQVSQLPNIETFCPRVRFQKVTRTGKKWFTEAMFPNYLFARFDWESEKRLVQSSLGVAGIVHFGSFSPEIPREVIEELKSELGEEDIRTFEDTLKAGDEVTLTKGVFIGLSAVVSKLMPSKARVTVLLEFLGRMTETVVAQQDVLKRQESESAEAVLTRQKTRE